MDAGNVMGLVGRLQSLLNDSEEANHRLVLENVGLARKAADLEKELGSVRGSLAGSLKQNDLLLEENQRLTRLVEELRSVMADQYSVREDRDRWKYQAEGFRRRLLEAEQAGNQWRLRAVNLLKQRDYLKERVRTLQGRSERVGWGQVVIETF